MVFYRSLSLGEFPRQLPDHEAANTCMTACIAGVTCISINTASTYHVPLTTLHTTSEEIHVCRCYVLHWLGAHQILNLVLKSFKCFWNLKGNAKIWNRMTASVLKQKHKTRSKHKKVLMNVYLFWQTQNMQIFGEIRFVKPQNNT